ncbi:AraC family transcriptional regulator [Microvirga ossetica]|uniref:AraC family transcriptional regulator n=1 Tax=Microvirga ossetica TaxID=1882682 RepID=UPI001F33DA71|nr:AraC family transcriptional regulator [Microvirga ossetica]
MHQLPMTVLAMPPGTAGVAARLAAARARAAGLDPGPLLCKAGLSLAQLQDRDARLEAASQIAFLNLVADALSDEVLGFHLAETVELREADLLYFVLASSATLGEALARAERYSTLTNEGVLLQRREESDLRLRYSNVGVARHTDRHQVEFWARTLVRICQTLTGTSIKPIRVTFAHPRCGASGELDAFFGCEVAFASEHDDVVFARGASQLRLVHADPYLNQVMIRSCDQVLSHKARLASSIRVRVENALAPLLPHGTARAGEVARALGMSERTLARRLAEEGVTFLAVLDDMRKELALHYLADASLSISRIAWLLGYQEVSGFTHAFRRWTGQAPTQIRADLLNREGQDP